MKEKGEKDAEQGEQKDHIDWLYYPAVGAVEGGGTKRVKEVRKRLGFIEKLIGWWHWLLTGERYERE